MGSQKSYKAWMSETDADLIEGLLVTIAGRRDGPLSILEWGSGRSTLYYTSLLERLDVDYLWTSLEYDRQYFDRFFYPVLIEESSATIRWSNPGSGTPAVVRAGYGRGVVQAVCFPHGRLQPFAKGHEADRRANLDDFVGYPATLGNRYDLILVDGRMRRRCLIEAAGLLRDAGVAVLHDAHRRHYHCAFGRFASQRRVGDDLWLGANHVTSFAEYLPAPGGPPGRPVA